jgi:hypothetical protein
MGFGIDWHLCRRIVEDSEVLLEQTAAQTEQLYHRIVVGD